MPITEVDGALVLRLRRSKPCARPAGAAGRPERPSQQVHGEETMWGHCSHSATGASRWAGFGRFGRVGRVGYHRKGGRHAGAGAAADHLDTGRSARAPPSAPRGAAARSRPSSVMSMPFAAALRLSAGTSRPTCSSGAGRGPAP